MTITDYPGVYPGCPVTILTICVTILNIMVMVIILTILVIIPSILVTTLPSGDYLDYPVTYHDHPCECPDHPESVFCTVGSV